MISIKPKQKLKAFTVIEMLVVMMLSAIVIGLTYLYFTQFQFYIRNTVHSEEAYMNYNQFSFVIQKDMDDALEIFSGFPGELLLRLGNQEIMYTLEDEFAIRETDMATDSFKFTISGVGIIKSKNHGNLVQSVHFEVLVEKDKTLPFSYCKAYTSEILFQNYSPNIR